MSENNPFLYVANELKAINERVKEVGNHVFYNNSKDKVILEKRVQDLINYANKHDVPIKVSFEEILNKAKDMELGEMIEEDSYENSYEDSY